MKIEFECPQCRSMLRLDAVHGGHQALCPVCGNAVMVPLGGNQPNQPRNDSGWQSMGSESRDIEFPPGTSVGSPLGSSPVRQPNSATGQSPWSAPTQVPTQAWSNNPYRSNARDGLWTMALICGIVSLVMHVWFCGCGSLIGPVVAVMGLIATLFSRQGSKVPLLILNGIGLLIGLLMLGLLFAAMAFAH